MTNINNNTASTPLLSIEMIQMCEQLQVSLAINLIEQSVSTNTGDVDAAMGVRYGPFIS